MGNRTIRWGLGGRSVTFDGAGTRVWVYAAAIVAAELGGVLGGPLSGVLCHSALIVLLLNHAALTSAPYRRLLLALALIPLLRLLSVTMPLREIPEIYWYALIGVPLLIAVALTARRLGVSRVELGIVRGVGRQQLWVGACGLPLCVIAGLLGPTRAVPPLPDANNPLPSVVILVIFAAFAEELLFRGLLQRVAGEILGGGGLLLSSVLYMAMSLSAPSWSYILFIGLAGWFLGWCVARTGALWGAVAAHSVINLGATLISTTVGVRLRSGGLTLSEALAGAAIALPTALGLVLCVAILLRQLREAPAEPAGGP